MLPIYNESAQPLLNELVKLTERQSTLTASATRENMMPRIGEIKTCNNRIREVMQELQNPKYHAGS